MSKGSHRFQMSRHARYTQPLVNKSEARQAAVHARRLRRMTRRSSQLTVGSVVPGRVHTIKGDMMMVNLGGLPCSWPVRSSTASRTIEYGRDFRYVYRPDRGSDHPTEVERVMSGESREITVIDGVVHLVVDEGSREYRAFRADEEESPGRNGVRRVGDHQWEIIFECPGDWSPEDWICSTLLSTLPAAESYQHMEEIAGSSLSPDVEALCRSPEMQEVIKALDEIFRRRSSGN
jgi:hypothetical protein